MRARIRAKAAPKPRALTNEQRLLIEQLRPWWDDAGGGLWDVEPEYKFHDERRWRVDVALLGHYRHAPLAIEIEGGVFSRGRHSRGVGMVADMAKYNTLTEMGWRLLRFTPQQVRDGSALAQIERCL